MFDHVSADHEVDGSCGSEEIVERPFAPNQVDVDDLVGRNISWPSYFLRRSSVLYWSTYNTDAPVRSTSAEQSGRISTPVLVELRE